MPVDDPLVVVIVTYRSSDVIGPCLDSLLLAPAPSMRIIVVDNNSNDTTIDVVNRRMGRPGVHRVELIRHSSNRGYAAGVNTGLVQAADASRVWILNPDCIVPPTTPERLLAAADRVGEFALIGGRTLYADETGRIQSDGGHVNRWTGVCRLANSGAAHDAPPPGKVDFISGANMLASRAFLDRAGPMDEGYFLYYEEVDWARRRGDLPLILCSEAIVLHRAGTAIGSAAPGRPASAFANYFNYRSRMRFVRKHRPNILPFAMGFAVAKSAQLVLRGRFDQAGGALRGTLGLPAPASVRARLSADFELS